MRLGETAGWVWLGLWLAASFAGGGEVTGLTLINADTDRDIRPLADGATVDLAKDGARLNIRAEVSGDVASVRFTVDGRDAKTESTPPFSLAGDSGGDYAPWKLPAGRHTVTATPYPRAKAEGQAGTPLSIAFTVVGQAAGQPATRPRPRRDEPAPPEPPVEPAVTVKGGSVRTAGELKKWHKVTIAFGGPAASETAEPNPFTDYRLNVTFRNGERTYVVPGYYAADGNAAETSAAAGNVWRVHFCPDATGQWTWTASFRKGPGVAARDEPDAGDSAGAFDGATGTIGIGPTDKTGRDHRAAGRLQYVGKHHLRFAETGRYFVKGGADAPENFLACDDIDNTPDYGGRRKSWAPHVKDFKPGDPTWQGGKGKGIIGALNYLARDKGMNAFSFLTMNIKGDDRNVFPYRSDRGPFTRFDCSKLAQWEVIFEHADHLGLYLHFKMQEAENDRLLDGGEMGLERRMYFRELVARFGHHLALNWNLCEENHQTTPQRIAMTQWLFDHDPYRHHVVIHNGRSPADLLGDRSKLTGYSLQTGWQAVHAGTREWVAKSAAAGRCWVVANDEQNPANDGIVTDQEDPNHDGIRQQTLWGNLMAGGGGVEYYFGYRHPHSDLTCQDFRTRDRMWDMTRHALVFFQTHLPFWEMTCQDEKTSARDDFCLCKPGEVYAVYLPNGGTTTLDLTDAAGDFEVRWYDPRNGGRLQVGSVKGLAGGAKRDLGQAPQSPEKDWAVVVRKERQP